MLVIRLARGGRAKYPTYRIVAAESARAATGKFIEILGHYNPHTKELVIKKEETEKRLSHGAQPSNTVIKLLQREGVALPSWVKLKTKTAPAVAVAEAAEETPEQVPADDDSEQESSDDETRVAEVATDRAIEVSDGQDRESTNRTETAEDTEAAADAAKQGSEAAAEVAQEAADEQKQS